ncbi:hypothetical protein H6P81_002133 [Aristolochia fimbriata]|uniref:Uncharacterized protein n=1 Tax=Aristolochia fimbriata TaxID=158543 RepID=A0AAV7F8Z0_ARIFI|nr:hypothetical protein H6P81_002133 [Aristolochia fimbriata]
MKLPRWEFGCSLLFFSPGISLSIRRCEIDVRRVGTTNNSDTMNPAKVGKVHLIKAETAEVFVQVQSGNPEFIHKISKLGEKRERWALGTPQTETRNGCVQTINPGERTPIHDFILKGWHLAGKASFVKPETQRLRRNESRTEIRKGKANQATVCYLKENRRRRAGIERAGDAPGSSFERDRSSGARVSFSLADPALT